MPQWLAIPAAAFTFGPLDGNGQPNVAATVT